MTHSKHRAHKSIKVFLKATVPLRFHVGYAAEGPLFEFIRFKKVNLDETKLFSTPNDAKIIYPIV